MFAAFGLFMGYLLPAENVMQILGPVLALLAFAGGLFVPLGDGLFADIAKVVPTYGLAEIVRAPLTGDGAEHLGRRQRGRLGRRVRRRRRVAVPPRHGARVTHARRRIRRTVARLP